MDYFWILLIVSGIIVFAIRYWPRRKKELPPEKVGMQELGFQEVKVPPAPLKRDVINLQHKYEGQLLVLHDVYNLDRKEYQVYIFDIEDQGGKEPMWLAQDMMAILMPGLNLPRFTIISRPQASGGMGKLMDRFMTRIAKWDDNLQNLKQIHFQELPTLEQRYFIFGTDEERTRHFLEGKKLDFFANLSGSYAVDGYSETVTMVPVYTNRQQSRRQRIEITLSDAQNLAEMLIKADS
jgi:hypothetical protein